jgi:uncharacterized protein involved in copper resistance
MGLTNRESIHGEMPDRKGFNTRAPDTQAAYGESANRYGAKCCRANGERADGRRRQCAVFRPFGQFGFHGSAPPSSTEHASV